MDGSDFHYSHLLPQKPPIAGFNHSEEEAKCGCGAVFTRRSRGKIRCDACQAIRKEALQKKALLKLREKRKALKETHEPGRPFGSRPSKYR